MYEAAAFVSARIRIEEYRMQYPQAKLFAKQEGAIESELFWNPRYSKRALIEVLSSLEGLTAFVTRSGQPSSFATIITHFETFLHTKLPRPYQIRTQILDRKIKRTAFIDKMRTTLLQKYDEY